MTILHSAAALLAVISFGLTLLSGIKGNPPLWIPVLLLSIAVLVMVIPA